MKLITTRRNFLKGVAATSGAAALVGCSKSDNNDNWGNIEVDDPTMPNTMEGEELYRGIAAHNCGGRCVLTAHVKGGVVKRFTTDERPDLNMVDGYVRPSMQRRACVRCRSKKEWLYRTDRLLYPLKQTRERGDITGFERITWKQAFNEIADKLVAIKTRDAGRTITTPRGPITTTGCEGFYFHYSTGDGAAFPRARPLSAKLLQVLGGDYAYRDDYSYPCHYFAGRFNVGESSHSVNSMTDLVNSELIVLWSWNGSENIQNTNSSWIVTQARDIGVPVVSVEQWLSKAAYTLSTGYKDETLNVNVPPVVSPVSGTDAALAAAMMYHLVDTYATSATAPFVTFIKNYVHGFFDDPTATDLDTNDHSVPDGASYSAYLFGSENTLVTRGINGAPSVYPNKIGYNVRTYTIDGEPDPLLNKYSPIYGQTPKTPEWAERITGVPAQVIKDLAEAVYRKKTTILCGGGFQRNTEGEQGIMSVGLLGFITENFGIRGASVGWNGNGVSGGASTPSDPGTKGPFVALRTTTASNIQAMKNFDTSKLTNTAMISATLPRSQGLAMGNDKTFPCFMWQDAIELGGTGQSRWNSPEIANGPQIKVLLNFGGNCVINQQGHVNLSAEICKDKSYCELIVSTDYFMNASCLYSDYVLPAAMAFEKNFVSNQDEAVLYSPKAVQPPAEVLSDFDITMGIAEAMGYDDQMFVITASGTAKSYYNDEEIIKAQYDAGFNETNFGMTFEDFKKAGIITPGQGAGVKIKYAAFRSNPATAPLNTPSGKFEAYSRAAIENYEARGYNNNDLTIDLVGGEIVTKTDGTGSANAAKGRYVYPIPMYIPLIEGRHACDNDDSVPALNASNASEAINNNTANGATKHPDPMGTNAAGYTMRLHTWHMMYRSHSTLASNGLLTEHYKVNSNGEITFTKSDRTASFMAGNEIYDEDIFEPVFLHPTDAAAVNLPENGALVYLYNDRGAIKVYARSNPLVHPGEIMIGQGSWTQFEAETTVIEGKTYRVDRGGNANSVNNIRPSRICQGMSLANDCKVGIKLV